MKDESNDGPVMYGYVRDLDTDDTKAMVLSALEEDRSVIFKDSWTNDVQFLKELFEVDTFSKHERFYLVVEGYEESGIQYMYEDYISEWEDWELYIENKGEECE